MSAIFGIINKKGNSVDKDLIAKMQQSLLHRAIDGKNIYTDGKIMFGHHKLTVHRRQTNEQQPLEADDCIITADARIDSFEELKKELELDSLNITDSFIILKAYKKWGKDCVNHLEGEFAFAIWDKVNKTFYGASDHIGFRTFYYYENKEIFAFASEIKALESIKPEPLELNEEIFFDHYTNIHHPITYDKNIHVVQSAHYILLGNNDKIKSIRYWLAKPKKKYKFKHNQEWYDCLLKLITEKITCQIDSDYPIGILLSGGLDSSFVCAIACKLLKEQNRKLLAFSSVLPEDYNGTDKDERFYIEKLKERFDNLEVHYVPIPEDVGPYSNLEKAFERVESPVNTFHYVEAALFEAAKKLNVRTLLTGFGGDMTISYNGNGVIYHYLARFNILKALKLFFKKYRRENYSLASQIKMEILGQNQIYRKIRDSIKKDNHKHIALKKEYLKKIIKIEKIPNRKINFEKRLGAGKIGGILIGLRKHANAFQQEFLCPLLCKSVCELYIDIPQELFLLNGIKRSLIKETMRNFVPKEIINRMDKMPFSPDYNKRIAVIKLENLQPILKNQISVEKIVGIDFEILSKSILNIKQSAIMTEWQPNKELSFIPNIIIQANFYLWLKMKNVTLGKKVSGIRI